MKHTQGEWKIQEDASTDCVDIIADGEQIATVWRWNRGGRLKADSEVNAKLIAAAPDLLEALQTLMNVYEQKGQLLSFDVNIARNAIKKATE